MQRWGNEQAPGSSVLLRTGALMSLASLGTAGLVLCGALAVVTPTGGTFSGAFGTGPSSVTDQPSEAPTILAAPSARRSEGQTRAPRRSGPAPARDTSTAVLGLTDGLDPLSGTTSAAARTPSDLDSVFHPVPGQVGVTPSLVVSSSPEPLAATPGTQRPMSAVRVAPAAPAAPVQPPAPEAAPVKAPVKAAEQAPQVGEGKAPRAPRAAKVPRAPQDAHVAKPPKAPPVAKARKAPQVAQAPQVAKARKAPQVVKAPNAPQVVKAPKAPQVVKAPKAPKAPQVVKAPKAPQVVKAPKAPQVVKAPKAPQVVKAPQVATAPTAPEPAPPASQAAPEPATPQQDVGRQDHPKGEPPGQGKGNGPKH